MGNYFTAIGEATAEYIEKRSKFIATVRHCDCEEEALSFIEEMRSKYWDAKHNCFAYSVAQGKSCRFSDDGEPHGTAGKPMLDVINGSGITDIAVVVTRYFGGILLGTGGLVRAYSKATKDALSSARIAEMINCSVFSTDAPYTDHAKLVSLIESQNGIIKESEFTDSVKVTYILREADVEAFLNKLSENFSAKLTAKELEKSVYPIEIEKNL